MTLLRFITEEERLTLENLSTVPELIIEGTGHTYLYYGVKYKEGLSSSTIAQLETINNILVDVIKGFSSFSNFTPKGTLRFQYAWDSSFKGVGYISINQLHKGFDPEESQA